MKIEELRIGDIVKNKGEELVVVESIISKDCILCSGENNRTKQTWEKYEESELYPVELSSGILINRFGFFESDQTDTGSYKVQGYIKHTPNCHIELVTDNHSGVYISNRPGTEWSLHLDNLNHDSIGSADIQYLHQAQNIIFDITGENVFKL